MKTVYQLHLDGKDRAYHNFRTEDEAIHHQGRLIKLCKSKIAAGELSAKVYLKEAKALEVVSLQIPDTSRVYSVVEVTEKTQGVVKNYFEKEVAIAVCLKISEGSSRYFSVMESFVNGTR